MERERTISLGSLLMRTLILLDQGPTFMILFNLNYILKVLSPKTVDHEQLLGLEALSTGQMKI